MAEIHRSYHSPEEVVEDIRRFEKIGKDYVLKIGNEELNSKIQFLQLYSECHDSSLANTETVDDLKQRINRYLIDFAIPEIDIDIAEEAIATIYLPTGALHDKHVMYRSFTNESDFKNELRRLFSLESTAMSFMIIFPDRTFKMEQRNTH